MYKIKKILGMNEDEILMRLVETENFTSSISIKMSCFKDEGIFPNEIIDNVSVSLDEINSSVNVMRQIIRNRKRSE